MPNNPNVMWLGRALSLLRKRGWKCYLRKGYNVGPPNYS